MYLCTILEKLEKPKKQKHENKTRTWASDEME